MRDGQEMTRVGRMLSEHLNSRISHRLRFVLTPPGVAPIINYDVGILFVFCNNVSSKQTPPNLIVCPPQSSNHNSHIFDRK